jgi:branched-subunit amino acid aminotransferase/4-amino-4-deoxychorismate lyase
MTRVGTLDSTGPVGAPVQHGLIETIRARHGRLPFLEAHLARLRGSLTALCVEPPATDLRDLVRMSVGAGDRVVRLEVRHGHAEITTREVPRERGPVAIVAAEEPYRPYPYKTTEREQFGKALAAARRSGATDALLLTADGVVAEGTTWSLFWWDGPSLCTPAAELGVLPGVGRARVMQLEPARGALVTLRELAGHSLFLVNAVRGIVEIAMLEGQALPPDPRTAELSQTFWPD